MDIDLNPLFLSFKLAFVTTIILFVASVPLSWWLSQTKSKLKPAIEALSAMPIVLPPTVIGFYLLVLFSPNSIVGEFLINNFDIKLIFSFEGLVVASCIYSLPFMVQPLQAGFESLNKNLIETSYVYGKNQLQTMLWVGLGNIKPSILIAVVITFAHTIGEFGVVLMIGGSVPDETKVASVAIYEFVEVLNYDMAHIYSLLMLCISFVVLFLMYLLKSSYKTQGSL